MLIVIPRSDIQNYVIIEIIIRSTIANFETNKVEKLLYRRTTQYISSLLKQSKPGNHLKPIQFSRVDNERNCTVSALYMYIIHKAEQKPLFQ